MTQSPFGMVPRDVIRNASLSPWAFRLFADLDERQGTDPRIRVGRQTLADGLGTSLSTVKRSLEELEAAGLIHWIRTGRTSIYIVLNSARVEYPERVAAVAALKRESAPDGSRVSHRAKRRKAPKADVMAHGRAIRKVTGEPFTEKDNLRKTTTTAQAETAQPKAPAPAGSSPVVGSIEENKKPGADLSAEVQRILNRIPDRCRPSRTKAVTAVLTTALQAGWAESEIDEAIDRYVKGNPSGQQGAVYIFMRDELAAKPPQSGSASKLGEQCGSCGPNRQMEDTEGRPYPCPTCNPVRHAEWKSRKINATTTAALSDTADPAMIDGLISGLNLDEAHRAQSDSLTASQGSRKLTLIGSEAAGF